MAVAIQNALFALTRKAELTGEDLETCFEEILSGQTSTEHLSAFLMGLAVRGEAGRELLAGARVMRRHARKIELSGDILDTCGTGGLGWTSLNTSTASAIVIAASGGKVAKHGNRSVPPKTGSADVLEALDVALDIDEHRFRDCVETAGVGFLFARTHHAAMKHVAPVRAALGIRTIFNLLGPLSNPASATHQILGVYDPVWIRPMAEALGHLGVKHAWVVHGTAVDDRAIDELSIAGETLGVEVKNGMLSDFRIHPSDAGLEPSPLSALSGGDPEYNANAIRRMLAGESGAFLDAVLLNASAGLLVLGLAADLKDGVVQARAAIASGRAAQTLHKLSQVSNGR